MMSISFDSLFSQVVVPSAIITELLHEDAPEAVRAWAAISRRGFPSRRIHRGTNFRCSPALMKATLDRFTAP